MATILLLGIDPVFTERLRQLLAEHHLVTAEYVDEPELVIVDIARVEPEEVSDAYPEVPILGYSHHADPSTFRIAREAGFDRIVERSELIEDAQALVSDLALPLE